MNNLWSHSQAVLVLALLSSASPAGADNPDPSGAVSELGEITVTAQRRDESLSRTPVAVSVISADTLAKAQVVSEADLRFAAPGLNVQTGNTSNQLNYSLRGQSKDQFSGASPGVLPYFNEVQIGGAGGSTAFYDLQSVQVLKGPQGTLFGRSATGGAVLFTSAKPTDTFGGYGSVSYGNFDAKKLEGALNVPLIGDTLMGRVAGYFQRREGYQFNTYNDQRQGDLERTGARISLTANLWERLHDELVFDYLHSTGGLTDGVFAGLTPFTGTGAPFIPITFLYAGTSTPIATATGIGTLQAFTGASPAAAAAYYNSYFANPHHPTGGFAAVLATQKANGPYVINDEGINAYNGNNTLATNLTTFEIDADTKIKNVAGFNEQKSSVALDSDGTPFGVVSQGVIGNPNTGAFPQTFKTRQISDELQILGQALDHRLDYVAGLYFSDDTTRTRQGGLNFDILFGGALGIYDYQISSKTKAIYAQSTYKLNDNGLAFTLGGRYTRETASSNRLPDDSNSIALGNPPPPGYTYNQSRLFQSPSWTVGLQDQIDPNLLVYIVTRRANKSGGFNGAVAPLNGSAAVGGDEFELEKVIDVEFGAKFQGHLGYMPARLGAALYNNWVTNDQRTAYTLVNNNPATITVNVPTGRTYGAELEAQVYPLRWLMLGATFNYTQAAYTDGNVIANKVPQTYDQVPDTSKFSGTLMAEATLPIVGDLTGVVHGDLYDQTKSYTTGTSSQNAYGTTLDGYAVANFHVGVDNNKGGWSVTANVKNAFNRVYYTGGIPLGNIFQINTLVPAEPRTYTVEGRWKF